MDCRGLQVIKQEQGVAEQEQFISFKVRVDCFSLLSQPAQCGKFSTRLVQFTFMDRAAKEPKLITRSEMSRFLNVSGR